MSLQTGTEMITLALLINKVTGLYGLLAILTGFALDAVQLSMYLYSVAVLVALAFLLPYVRRQTPLPNLALAWLYLLDTALNAAYTVFFAVAWFAGSGGNPTGDAAELARDTSASMVLIVAFTLVRGYLMLVVMSFARQVMRRYVAGLYVDGEDKGRAARPFAVGSPEGEGCRGNLGRALVYVGEEYWIGARDDDEEWAAGDSAARVPLAAAVDEDGE